MLERVGARGAWRMRVLWWMCGLRRIVDYDYMVLAVSNQGLGNSSQP